MEKKYTIEVNERQARLLSYACDQFARLIQGQDAAFQDLMEMAWEKRCKNATGNMMDKEWDGGWHTMREEAILHYGSLWGGNFRRDYLPCQ